MHTRATNLWLEPRAVNDLEVCYFLERSDLRSLYTQIKDLVTIAQDVAENELNQKRERLRRMLEEEDKIYEEEFAHKVKRRTEEDIRMRKESLLQIKEERKRQEKEFLKSKNLQQQWESCFEVRDALRLRETKRMKETQLQQMMEKQCAQLRERQLDDYWQRVHEVSAQRSNQRQTKEDQMKQDMKCKVRCDLDQQMETQKREAQRQRAQQCEEAKALIKIAEEVRLAEYERKRAGLSAKMLAYREDLLAAIAENKAKRDAEECVRTTEHRQLMHEITQEQQEYSAALLQRKRAVYNATMEYLDYARRIRKFEKDTQNMRNARIDDLRHVDICTDTNVRRELQRKAEMAALCYAELRRQMCEEYERRLRDAQEQREPKIIENRFAHPEKTRADIMAARRKMRLELDKQLIENARIRAQEEAKYNAELKQVVVDPEFCKELAENYLNADLDYLPPHANWLIYACPQKQFVGKQLLQGAAGGDRNPDSENTCRKPCGCQARPDLECPHYSGSVSNGDSDPERKRFELETC